MRVIVVAVVVSMAAPAPANTPVPQPDPGIYTNEEEVYFDKEAGRRAAPWFGIAKRDGAPVELVDPYGEPATDQVEQVEQVFKRDADHVVVVLPGAKRATTLRRARPVTCWGSVPRLVKKSDGSDDWYFAAGLKLHDQGGRTRFGGANTVAPEVILRIRNVVWPTGTNKPSVVLYVHKPDSPDRAEAYSWADPQAKRIGINLRWMQASCTIE